MSQRFARPYATATLDAAKSIEAGQAVLAELQRFVDATREVPAILRMAANPAVPREVKETVLTQISSILELGPLAKSLLDVLLRNYRLVHVEAIAEATEEILNRRSGVVTAQVTTAQAVDEEQEARLRRVLEDILEQKVLMTTSTSPDLLAGFVARIGSRRYDASLSGQLQRLASSLSEG
ncbi:MAG: ATP synthase F1 subunit delta [Acidobacteriota bacterium]|nr:ATP synthase F1 subunit delta [Acidobacteriota bacterium]